MTRLPDSLLRAIGQAVQNAGGTMADVEDLVRVWQRLDADLDRRATRMRYEAQTAAQTRAADGDTDEYLHDSQERSGPGGDQ